MKDEKMLRAMGIDYENNKVKVDLDKLYVQSGRLNNLKNDENFFGSRS